MIPRSGAMVHYPSKSKRKGYRQQIRLTLRIRSTPPLLFLPPRLQRSYSARVQTHVISLHSFISVVLSVCEVNVYPERGEKDKAHL
jgi:hypothetical protein